MIKRRWATCWRLCWGLLLASLTLTRLSYGGDLHAQNWKIISVAESNSAGGKIYYAVVRKTYVVQSNDTLSDILFRNGLISWKGFELYPPDGWLQRNKSLNPGIKTWDQLVAGTTITIEYPKRISIKTYEEYRNHQNVNQPFVPANQPAPERSSDDILAKQRKLEETAAREEKERADELKRQEEIVSHAEGKSIDAIVELPPYQIERIPPAVVANKLTDEKIATLKPEEAERIPEPVVKEKARDASFFDSLKPGMGSFFQALEGQTAGGYLGLRIGHSLASPSASPLVSKINSVGLLAELRNGPLGGLRVYWDYVPKVTAAIDDQEQSVGWQRLSLAYAFEFNSPVLVDHIHLIPKLGRYAFAANIPSAENADGTTIMHAFSIGQGFALGLEGDAEISSIFYVLRGWVARDISGVGVKTSESITSTRFGLDGFLKGGGFTLGETKLSLAYLAFITDERLDLHGSDDTAGDFTIHMNLPYAGAGISLQW